MDNRLRACTGNCRHRPDGDRFYVLHDLIRSGRSWPAGDPGRIQSRLYANPTKHAGVRYRYRPNPERNRRIHHSILGHLEQWLNFHESYAAVQYLSGFNCGLTAAASQGVFFLACYVGGGDTPAWVFAFTPGDGNPAHAGASGGPKLIGLINTFNTPNPVYFSSWPVPSTQGTIVGRSLHGIGETGETGWINVTANDYEPINTSATSMPATSAACSTFTGLSSLSGQCILVHINSYTHGNVAYISGATSLSGVIGQYVTLTTLNGSVCGGVTAKLYLTSTRTITTDAPIIGVTGGATQSISQNCLDTSTSATVTNGTATGSGTAVLANYSVTGYEPYFQAPPPLSFLGTPGEFRTAQIGDTACFTTTSATSCNWDGGAKEIGTLEIKNYGSVNGAWVFQRQAYGAQKAVTGPIALWWESFDHVIPPTSSTPATGQVYWNPLAGCGGSPDPHGNCLIEDSNATGSHGESRNGGASSAPAVPDWGQPIWGWPFAYQTEIGFVPGVLSLPFANVTPYQAPGVNYAAAEPPFAGVFGHPWGFDGGNHPNAAGANASAYESIRAFDNIPVQGGQNEPTYTFVTGQLSVATPTSVIDADDPFGYGSIVAINRKLMATGASCGSHPLIDVSGPSSSIGTGAVGSYTYGIVRAAGELYPGSTVGQIYVNCPGVAWPTCTGTGVHGGTPLGVGNDICVGNIGNAADSIIQYSLDQPSDYYGASRRALVSATSRLRMVYGFENNALLPDNSWILYRQEWLNYQRPEMWMAKNLPYPPRDSVARGTFVPWPVRVSPPVGLDVNNAVIEFGYQEYGAPQLINCTTRNDACIATASTVTPGNQPFYFASENPAGASCASGCTIAIPAISQRVLYYQVTYRAANNTVLSSDPPIAVVVP